MRRFMSRRRFFGAAAGAAALARGLNALPIKESTISNPPIPDSLIIGPTIPDSASDEHEAVDRVQAALNIRTSAAAAQSKRPAVAMQSNGEEDSLPDRIACYAKGLPQNRYGEVDPAAYKALLSAVKSGKFEDFEAIPRAGGRRQSNPQSGNSFHLEGGDSHTFSVAPAPGIASGAAERDISELYWQALCRDVPFKKYSESPIVKEAAEHLGTSPDKVFRGPTWGDLNGPYISQYLLKPIPYGAGRLEQKYSVPNPGSNFVTTEDEWTQVKLGYQPWLSVTYDPTPRYIRNGRDLSEYVHYDFAYQACLGAALILINANAKSVLNCNQFKSGSNPYRYSTVEEGFVTFGPVEAADWMGRVSTAALKAAYFQKWMVHRRLRPEELGGLIHLTRTGERSYPVHDSILHSAAVERVHKETGSYLLPQAFPEGCPMHPSYPSGHAALAGACSVVLKTCFDGTMLLPGCVEPSEDGLSLQPCTNFSTTVGAEIDKLAFNIAMGRDWAGIHYRSDSTSGLLLGEEVGISIVQDLARTYTENFKGFTFTRFDGSQVHITPQGQLEKL